MALLDDFEKWKRDGFAILAKLETLLSETERRIEALNSERDRLQAHAESLRNGIAEVRERLPRNTPRHGDPTSARDVIQALASVAVKVAPDAPVIDIVRAVLAVAEGHLTAKEIIQCVRTYRAEVPAEDVHRALYRLKEAKEIEIHGERPNRLYSLRDTSQTTIAVAL